MSQVAKYTKLLSDTFIFWSDIRNNPYDTVVFDLFDIYGKEYDVCEKLTKYIFNQAKINTSDTNYISYIYKSFVPTIPENDSVAVFSDLYVLEECTSLEDFFLSTNGHIIGISQKENPFVIDNEKNALYTSKEYNNLNIKISSVEFKLKQIKIPVWNMFDNLGDLVSLRRLPFENNISYHSRIKDVFIHLPGNNFSGLVNAVSREINKRTYIEWFNTTERFIIKDKNVLVDSITIVYSNGVTEYPEIYTSKDKELIVLPLSGTMDGVFVSYVNFLTIHDLNNTDDYFVKRFYYNQNGTAKKNLTAFAREIRTNTYETFVVDQTYRQQKAQNFLPSLYDGSVNGFKKYNHMTIEEIEQKIILKEK